MAKINMIHKRHYYPAESLKTQSYVNIDEENYRACQKVMFKAGYEGIKKQSIVDVGHVFVPQCWIGALVDDRIVGVCAAQFGALKNCKELLAAQIAGLAVLPDYCNRGIGTFLVDRIICNLLTVGYKNIYVAVHDYRPAAVKVYERVGFERM